MELRSDINMLLRKAKAPRPNLKRQESIGLAQLKMDKDMGHTYSRQGVAMVVMDREEYVTKSKGVISPASLQVNSRDPTNKIKAQLITKLRKIKKDNNLDEGTYKAMYPIGLPCILKFIVTQIHKTGNPLRPIVSGRGSVTYGVAKVLSKVLKPLVVNPSSYTKCR